MKRLGILKKIDKKLLIVSMILFAVGLVMIYSASNVTAFVMNGASPAKYFVRQFAVLIVGFIFAYLILKIFKIKSYHLLSWIGLIGIAGFILFTVVCGVVINGATNWITGIPIIGQFQPSEVAKILIIPIFAIYYESNLKDNDNTFKMSIPLLAVGVIATLIMIQKDFGTAFILLALAIMLFFISPVSIRLKKLLFTICAVGVAIVTIGLLAFGNKVLDQDKIDRFNFKDPCSRYLNTGNQLCNGYIAINDGGLLGKGLGNSTQKYLYLPESHTDFIFAVFIEELGFVGGAGLMILYGYLLYRIIMDGRKATSSRNRTICYGVAIYLFLHIFINLGGVLGIIPVTGIPLAFMSYGGTYCICLIAALTMVQRVVYETNINKS